MKPLHLILVGLIALGSGAGPVLADFEDARTLYLDRQYGPAFDAFSDIAATGDPRAQTVLAIMYLYGEGVAVDAGTAFNWYMKAATQSYAPAQYQVGRMLANGIGVETDTDAALTWLRRAEEAGYELAAPAIGSLNETGQVPDETDKPTVWSRQWNLTLPNDIRFRDDDESAEQLLLLPR